MPYPTRPIPLTAPPATHRRPRSPHALALLVSAAAIAAASSLAAAASPRPVGPDIPIAVPGQQSAVAVGDDGGFVVAWRTGAQGADGTVWLQRFAADDRPLGPPRLVGGDRWTFFDNRPAVGLAADGGAVVAWTGPGASVRSTIQVRLFDADGLPRGPAFRVSGGLESAEPKLAVAPDGRFVVAWTGLTDGRNPDAYARRFAADGGTEGARFLLHDDTFNDQLLGGLALAPDGRLAAVFASWEGEGQFLDVFLSLFAADGTPVVLDRRVNTDPEVEGASQREPAVVRLADGRWLVVFSSPAVDDGSFVGQSVYGRLFAADGEPLGDDRLLPEIPRGLQDQPVAAPLADGGFVVAWRGACDVQFSEPGACDPPQGHRDGHLAGVFGRAFDAAGEPAGDDFRVNGETFGNQALPALAAGPAGDLVATWTTFPDPFATGGEASVSARRLAAPCAEDGQTLCLGGGRFRADVVWNDFFGNSGPGVAEARDDLWGTFWFFDPQNLELAVKLIDGRAVNGRYWIFFGSLSNVEYTLRVTDTATGRVATYRNPSGTFASRGDTAAFEEVETTPDDAGGEPVAGSVARWPGSAKSATSETGSCQAAADRLCLLDGRFAVSIAWQDPSGGAGQGHRMPLTDDTGAFWFFRDDNPEVLVKVLDARSVNGRFWVFFGSLTDVAFELVVTDTASGETRTYENPQGHFASRGDTTAFPLPGGS